MIAVIAVLSFISLGYYLLVSDIATAPSGPGPGGDGTMAPTPSSDSDNVPMPNWNMPAHTSITNDPGTWPSGDRIWLVCHGIAMQEGAAQAGSAPDRNNNPGDLSDGADQYGYDPNVHDSRVTHFPDKETGWRWLYDKIKRAADGRSSVYKPDMTWNEIGTHWAADPNWAHGVASFLGVSANSTLRQFVG